MERSFESEIWRLVPPEEKFELMAKAQSKGVLAASIALIVCGTVAVGLKMSWVMWGSIVCCPFIFQFAAGKAWRGLRPRCLLEYLAARSASRRYAFAARAKDLTPSLIFKGRIEQVYEQEHLQEALEAMVNKTKEAEVWVSLFGDAVVMISEQLGGAQVKFSHLLDEKLEVTGHSSSGKEYASDKHLLFTVHDKMMGAKQFRLTSRYPAALVAFEKKMQKHREIAIKERSELLKIAEVVNVEAQDNEDDGYLNLFTN